MGVTIITSHLTLIKVLLCFCATVLLLAAGTHTLPEGYLATAVDTRHTLHKFRRYKQNFNYNLNKLPTIYNILELRTKN